MVNFFTTILYEPLFNGLMFIYKEIPGIDLGIAIIILTIFIKLLLFWPSLSSIKAQKNMQEIQPKIDEIKRKYGNNKEEQSKQLMDFYKKNKVNPFSSCLPLLIQLPILWALYRVFWNGLHTDPATGALAADQVNHLYGYLKVFFAGQPIKTMFLGIVDLQANKNIILAVLAGAAQFVQSWMLMAKNKKKLPNAAGAKDEKMAQTMTKQMTYFMPIITVIFGYQFPAGLTLYWLVSTLLMIAQQAIFVRRKKDDKDNKIIEGQKI